MHPALGVFRNGHSVGNWLQWLLPSPDYGRNCQSGLTRYFFFRELAPMIALTFLLMGCLGEEFTLPGDHPRTLRVAGVERSYIVHIPTGFLRGNPTPVVLCLHGAGMTGKMMANVSDLNKKADQSELSLPLALVWGSSSPGTLAASPLASGAEPMMWLSSARFWMNCRGRSGWTSAGFLLVGSAMAA